MVFEEFMSDFRIWKTKLCILVVLLATASGMVNVAIERNMLIRTRATAGIRSSLSAFTNWDNHEGNKSPDRLNIIEVDYLHFLIESRNSI